MPFGPNAANAAAASKPPSVWTHSYSAQCYPEESQYNPQACTLGIDGPTGEEFDLQIGQELVDHSAISGAHEKLTITAPPTCATGSLTLYTLTHLGGPSVSGGSEIFKFDLRQGSSIINTSTTLFTGPWHVLIQPSLSGLVPASNCPGLPVAGNFPLTLTLEAASNGGSAGGLRQYPTRSGKLHVEFTATGGGTFDVVSRIRKLHSKGRWVTFGKIQKKETAPHEFVLTIRPATAAKRLIRKGGYMVRGRGYFDLQTTVSVVDLYGRRSSTYDRASYSFKRR